MRCAGCRSRGGGAHELPDRAPDRGDRAAVAGATHDDRPPTAASLQPARFDRPRRAHRSLGARLIEFAGWEMPVQYHGHPRGAPGGARARRAVRPVAHGRAVGHRPGCRRALAYALVTDPARLATGRAHYSMIVRGRRRDHRRPHRLSRRRRALPGRAQRLEPVAVVDALARTPRRSRRGMDDASLRTSLVAVQGPRAAELLAR